MNFRFDHSLHALWSLTTLIEYAAAGDETLLRQVSVRGDLRDGVDWLEFRFAETPATGTDLGIAVTLDAEGFPRFQVDATILAAYARDYEIASSLGLTVPEWRLMTGKTPRR